MTELFSAVTGLRCLTCAKEYPFQAMLTGCDSCRRAGRPAILDPTYDYAAIDKAVFLQRQDSLWAYHQLLPVPNSSAVTTLGEGQSPLLPMRALAERTGASRVWLKYEAVNPTHSFKDRANSVAVSVARQFGFEKVVCTSTGNHGVALCAYAARAGLRSLVLVPPGAPAAAIAEMRFFGATVITVTDGEIIPMLDSLVVDHGWYPSQRNAPGVGGRAFGNPFGMEGYKTLAYEVFQQLDQRTPDWLFVPIGGGDGGWGFTKGFEELRTIGLATSIPRLAACQSDAGAPLVHAMDEHLSQVARVPTRSTIAFSIVDPQTGDHALKAIRQTDGMAVAVTDDEIRAAEETLGQDGVCVEPASAASVAGLLRAATEDAERFRNQEIVLVGTGAGTRWPSTFVENQASAQVSGNIDALASAVEL